MSGMPSFLTGLVILGLGALLIWRGRAMPQTSGQTPVSTRQARQYRDAGVVIAVAGGIIFVISLVTLAK